MTARPAFWSTGVVYAQETLPLYLCAAKPLESKIDDMRITREIVCPRRLCGFIAWLTGPSLLTNIGISFSSRVVTGYDVCSTSYHYSLSGTIVSYRFCFTTYNDSAAAGRV